MKQLLLTSSLSLFLIFNCACLLAQENKNGIYADKQGRLRWQKDNSEMYLFGVNYTVPFAYGYRSVKALNIDAEKEIDADVYHMARMGVDAFRVHLWDTEISDSLGNLLQNEHLRLFDYLIYRLKERNIKIIITPIAFFGNGYPQRDEKTAGFSSKYSKGEATLNEGSIRAEENYLKQLYQHVNPYTKLSYCDEPDIIASELNNEPSHSGPKTGVTAYINRLEKAARNAGWKKPLFYNISQNPYYADAVAKSNVTGFSFQWYPTGLVAGHEQHGNFMPNVDRYHIPFDTIPEFKNRPRMVYEFDAADVLQSCIYPAVARSFKQAGFQWVTQFAYDPMATAYGNSEYQTHYLNLAYTPAKAISFLIANRVFHKLPRNKEYGTYPVDSVFDAYHVSYNQSMSEMNTADEFYYSGNTLSAPKDLKKLEHIAGVGSSVIVQYKGYGAYFIDKLESGVWRLEVMPDAITIRDPFERPSPAKEVVHIAWQEQNMQINLPGIGADFDVKAINKDNSYQTTAANGSFTIKPGTYLLVKKGKTISKQADQKLLGNISLNEFIAPVSSNNVIYVRHIPATEISANKAFTVNARVINVNPDDKVTLMVNGRFGAPVAIIITNTSSYDYSATIPAAQVVAGTLSYRIVVQQHDKYISFPGGHEGDPHQWDNLNKDNWQVFVAAPNGKLSLFNASTDEANVNTYYPGSGRNGGMRFTAGEETGQLALSAETSNIHKNNVMGFQLYVGDKIKYRLPEVSAFTKVVVRARMQKTQLGRLRVALTDKDASTYAAYVELSDQYKNIEIPLTAFKPDSSLLVPRPYPGFLSLWFKAGSFNGLSIPQVDKLEITSGDSLAPDQYDKPYGIEVESVRLEPK
ncbi:MAG: membrane or secreted protein [Mucilaginibacter sp.]|uniref:membrane or secreted protein n=1 Tax=Mucilaginibacter sp. TaxID=1882438 RepID=UPI0031A8877A